MLTLHLLTNLVLSAWGLFYFKYIGERCYEMMNSHALLNCTYLFVSGCARTLSFKVKTISSGIAANVCRFILGFMSDYSLTYEMQASFKFLGGGPQNLVTL